MRKGERSGVLYMWLKEIAVRVGIFDLVREGTWISRIKGQGSWYLVFERCANLYKARLPLNIRILGQRQQQQHKQYAERVGSSRDRLICVREERNRVFIEISTESFIRKRWFCNSNTVRTSTPLIVDTLLVVTLPSHPPPHYKALQNLIIPSSPHQNLPLQSETFRPKASINLQLHRHIRVWTRNSCFGLRILES